MDFSKLTYAQVQSIATQLKSYSTQMESLLNEIKSKFEKIGNDEVWSGTAAAEAKSTFDKLSAKFPEFSVAIDDCHTYLNQVVESYKAVDAAVTNRQ